ncbi:hypothetical protein LEN26_010946 [Aphanomyces euteiches]|nr:hypothetical protein LEN26_010946 [Aphanomyces euteiches]
MTARASPKNTAWMGKKTTKQRKRTAKKAQIVDIHKATEQLSQEKLKVAVERSTVYPWLHYSAFGIVAAIGAALDVVAIAIPDDFSSRCCKFLFVVITCVNIRTHGQFTRKPWWIRALVYILCNFAGATTICIARQEIPAYMRGVQPWVSVAIAAMFIEVLMRNNDATGREHCMWARAFCVVPVSLWKTKTLGRLVMDCYETGTPLFKCVPMVTADLGASGLMLVFLSHLDAHGFSLPTHFAQVERVYVMAQHLVVMGPIALIWKLEESKFNATTAMIAGGLVLFYNLVKYCWLPIDYFLTQSKKID